MNRLDLRRGQAREQRRAERVLAQSQILVAGHDGLGRDQLGERALPFSRISGAGQRQTLRHGQRRALTQGESRAELARVARESVEALLQHLLETGGQVGRVQALRQHETAGLVAHDTAVDQVPRELHAQTRLARTQAVQAIGNHAQVRHVAEDRAQQRLGLGCLQRAERQRPAVLLQQARRRLGALRAVRFVRAHEHELAADRRLREAREHRGGMPVDRMEVIDQIINARCPARPTK